MSQRPHRFTWSTAVRVARRCSSAVRIILKLPVRDRAQQDQQHRDERRNELFDRALREPKAWRSAFLIDACRDDRLLHADVLSLLEAHEEAGPYFAHLEDRVVTPVLSRVAHLVDRGAEDELTSALQADLADEYEIRREIGGGGMSRIFVAEDARLNRLVVIKVIREKMASQAEGERFRREIEIAAKLQHPHIVPVLSTGSAAGRLYYTMPLVKGESLSGRLERDGALPLEEALRIWRDILDALAYAHASGVVHRDVKPGNILLSGRHALVTDFGISTAIEMAAGLPSSTQPDRLIGTPAYVAPEQADVDGDQDHRVDIYSAAVVMYEMLAGTPPFAEASKEALLDAHKSRQPPPVQRPGVPSILLSLVTQCLSKDPNQRPQTADEMLAALEDNAEIGPGTSTDGLVRSGRQTIFRVAIVAGVLGLVLLLLTWFVARPTMEQPPMGHTIAESRVVEATNIEAVEWYRRGMDVALLRTYSGKRDGISYFERAIKADTAFVAAHAGLSRMYLHLASSEPSPAKQAWLELGKQAALTAVSLDKSDADARSALGWVHLLYRNYAAAKLEFVRAVERDRAAPRAYEGLARAYMMTGEAVAQLEAALNGLDLDPFSHSAIREWALALAANGRCEESLDRLGSLKRLSPPAGVAGIIGGQCYAAIQMWDEAIAEFRWSSGQLTTAGPALLGFALARGGYVEEANNILADLTEARTYSHGSWGIGIVFAGLRDYDSAFEWLHRAIDDGTMHFYMMHPAFEDLHADPRFERLRTRMAATETSL